MVRAILDGNKTQTRRVVRVQPIRGEEIAPYCTGAPHLGYSFYIRRDDGAWTSRKRFYPPYKVGDILWVKETFTTIEAEREIVCGVSYDLVPESYLYRADPMWDGMGRGDFSWNWTPSIYMPRDAARIFLKVTNVRVERLQDISEEDAIRECVDAYRESLKGDDVAYGNCGLFDKRTQFRFLWDSINGEKHPWKSNPWVWVYEFERWEGDNK